MNDYRRYIILRQSLQDARRREAQDSWTRALTDLANKFYNPKSFWNKIKQLLGKTTGPDSYLIDNNGQKLHTAVEKERQHRQNWRRIFEDDDNRQDANYRAVLNFLAVNEDRTVPYEVADPDRLRGDNILNAQISTFEIKHAINKTKNTCPGSSKINKEIIKHLPDTYIKRLKELFNAALSSGFFPDQFKGAEMRMIAKPGKPPTRVDSYRPISLLEVPGKILERILNHRLRIHLEMQQQYNPGQYGFRRGRGTTHAIALATEALALYQALGYRCNMVLRDVSKAFDKVWHSGLKFKLLQLDLPAPMERLLAGFTEGRTARVRVGNHLGPPFHLNTGVPQGSVLSPTLYTIYTRDYPSSAAGVNIAYADDITQIIFHPGKSKLMLSARSSREISRVNTYEEEWGIRTNMAKFKVVPIATWTPAPLRLDNRNVEQQDNGTLLGLQITSRGYQTHVTGRANKARAALGHLYRFRDLQPRLKLHLVKMLVLPILLYPPIPTHAMSRAAISRLQKVQNAALRFAAGVRWDDFTTTEAIHTAANVPALNVRLHDLAANIWRRMEEEGWEQFIPLQELHINTPAEENHGWFRRSLLAIESDPTPAPRYR